MDGPPGHTPPDPGRAVAIHWASKLASKQTHVFVDDYQRSLETKFTTMLLDDKRENVSVIVPASKRRPQRRLYWSIGSPT